MFVIQYCNNSCACFFGLGTFVHFITIKINLIMTELKCVLIRKWHNAATTRKLCTRFIFIVYFMEKRYSLFSSQNEFCLSRSSISCWIERFVRFKYWIYSAAFFRICALLATFSPCKAGTTSLRLEKLSLIWSLRFLSNALWWARFSA